MKRLLTLLGFSVILAGSPVVLATSLAQREHAASRIVSSPNVRNTLVAAGSSSSARSIRSASSSSPSPSLTATVEARKTKRRARALTASIVTAPKSAPAPAPAADAVTALLDQKDLNPQHRIILKEVLRLLPPGCAERIKGIYVRYDNPDQRGLAGSDVAIISGTVPDAEFRALLVHEVVGHVTDLGCLQGTSASGQSEFRDGSQVMQQDDPSVRFYRISWTDEKTRKLDAAPADFASGYAYQADAFEDFAESVALYVLQPDIFRERAAQNDAMAQKLRWIETELFPNGLDTSRSAASWNGDIPWDITREEYVWRGETVAAK